MSNGQLDKLENFAEFVGEIFVKIISDAVDASEENRGEICSKDFYTVKKKSDSGIGLCEDDLEDGFKNGEWIVLDEWNEISEENCLMECNDDEMLTKSSNSSSVKSFKKSGKRRSSKLGYGELVSEDQGPSYCTPNISKSGSIGGDDIMSDSYLDSIFQKDPEDKFHCETCGRGFDYYEDGIIHLESYHKLSNAPDIAKMLRLPKDPQMLKMFCCAFPDCPNLFSGSSANVLKCHMLTMHEDISLARTKVLMFCQLCKGDPFDDENDLDSHLAIVHKVDKAPVRITKTNPVYYYCIFCRKPIGPMTTWESHTNALLHRYKKSRFSLADENDNTKDNVKNGNAKNYNMEEAVVMTKREFSACKQEYELKELGKRRQNNKKYAMQKHTIFSRLGPKMVPCMNCPDIIRRDRIEMHINIKHPHASFQCNFFPKHRVRPCGKTFCTAKKTLAHIRSHFPEIRMCEAIDRALVKIPRDLRWMRCRICGRCYNGQGFQSMVDHVQEEHPKVGSSPASVTDFGCRLCGIVAHGVQGYDRLQQHIREKKIRSIIYNKKL